MKVKYINYGKPQSRLNIVDKGDWIDLRANTRVAYSSPCIAKDGTINFSTITVSLGIAMKLPKGYEAVINARSSLYRNYGLILVNGQGVIDNSFSGSNDIWGAELIAFRAGTVNEGDRIVQFKIQLSQKATIWQKIKWLFSNKIKFEEVKRLEGPDRGGFGSTGCK